MATRKTYKDGARAAYYYDNLHFATATRVGDLVWVSGQVGIDPATSAPADGITAQARFAFHGVKEALESAGAAMSDIVELMTFHTRLTEDAGEFAAVKDEFILEPYPVWTAVGVSELARPGLLVEIRVVASVTDR